LDFAVLDIDTKQKKITLSEKLNVICEAEANSMMLWLEIANCLGLALSSLSRIMLNKNKSIEENMKCRVHSKKKRNIKLGANEGSEKIL
jgi:hypothetical protein